MLTQRFLCPGAEYFAAAEYFAGAEIFPKHPSLGAPEKLLAMALLFPPGPPCPWHSWISERDSPPPAVPPPHAAALLRHPGQLIVVEITGDRLQWQPQMKANLSQHGTADGQGRGRQPGVTCACCHPCCPFPRSSAGVTKGPPKRQSPCAVTAAQGHGLMGVTEVCLTWCLFPK